MNGHNNYMVVGVFVSLGIVALIGMILFLAGDRSTEPTVRYTVLFERDTSGLALGAPTRFLGVEVGRVVAMSLETADRTRVRVDLEVLQSTPVTTATYASLSFQGVTGVAFVSLASDPDVRGLPLVADDNEFPVIPDRNTGLAALLSDGPEITHKINELLDRINQLLNEENQDSLSRSLANIDKLTQSLAEQEKMIVALPQQLQLVLQQIGATVSAVEATVSQAGPDVLATMSALNETSENLIDISERLDNWLADHDEEMQQFMEGGLAKTPGLIADMRSAIRELEKLVHELGEDASQLVYEPQSEAIPVEH